VGGTGIEPVTLPCQLPARTAPVHVSAAQDLSSRPLTSTVVRRNPHLLLYFAAVRLPAWGLSICPCQGRARRRIEPTSYSLRDCVPLASDRPSSRSRRRGRYRQCPLVTLIVGSIWHASGTLPLSSITSLEDGVEQSRHVTCAYTVPAGIMPPGRARRSLTAGPHGMSPMRGPDRRSI
jgi:hypothetical protein